MDYYVIKNKRTGRLVSGTNFNTSPLRQRFASETRPPLLLPADPLIVELELRRRGITYRDYKIVTVRIP